MNGRAVSAVGKTEGSVRETSGIVGGQTRKGSHEYLHVLYIREMYVCPRGNGRGFSMTDRQENGAN